LGTDQSWFLVCALFYTPSHGGAMLDISVSVMWKIVPLLHAALSATAGAITRNTNDQISRFLEILNVLPRRTGMYDPVELADIVCRCHHESADDQVKMSLVISANNSSQLIIMTDKAMIKVDDHIAIADKSKWEMAIATIESDIRTTRQWCANVRCFILAKLPDPYAPMWTINTLDKRQLSFDALLVGLEAVENIYNLKMPNKADVQSAPVVLGDGIRPPPYQFGRGD